MEDDMRLTSWGLFDFPFLLVASDGVLQRYSREEIYAVFQKYQIKVCSITFHLSGAFWLCFPYPTVELTPLTSPRPPYTLTERQEHTIDRIWMNETERSAISILTKLAPLHQKVNASGIEGRKNRSLSSSCKRFNTLSIWFFSDTVKNGLANHSFRISKKPFDMSWDLLQTDWESSEFVSMA